MNWKGGGAIRKLTVMILNSALGVMQLLLAYGNEESQPKYNTDESWAARLSKRLSLNLTI